MATNKLIGVDIGGTHIKAVLTDERGKIYHELSTPTCDIEGKDNSAVWKKATKDLIVQLQSSSPQEISAIGISSPGIINETNSSVISNGSKLLGIEGFIWSEYLNEHVFVLNDAHSALFAESRLGKGVNYKDIVMLTLGTGVGGGIMINRKLLQGQMGRAGHIGHLSVSQDLHMGIVNTPGSLESDVAEITIFRRSHGRYATTRDLVNDFRKNDPFASWVWLNSIHSLARGIVSLVNVLSPEIVIIGGGIAKAKEDLMNPLKKFLDIYEWRPNGFNTPIEFAALSNHAGAIGAALFSYERMNAL